MAAGGNVPQVGGYNYEFVAKVPDKLKCPICLLPLKNPMQVVKCGHRFCNLCISPILSNPRARCQVDRQPISSYRVFEDTACEREVLDLHVKCPSKGCDWSGELRNIEGHEGTCGFKLLDCKNASCEEKIMRSCLGIHMQQRCKFRTVTCGYCSEEHTWIRSQEHNDKCELYPLPCANNCGERDIARNKMLKHVKDVCPSAVIPCKYEHVGCEVKIRRDALQNHVEENMEKHLDLACTKLKQLENTPCSRQLNPTLFVWKISEFDKRLQEAKAGIRKTIHSDPFYTSPQGYKMKVQIDPNGFNSGESSHVSVYIRIMKGEYDGMLTWPFLPKITFTLIDQQEDGTKRENISKSLKPDATNHCFKKPVAEANSGWGFPQFASHDKLQTGRYIVDNTTFFKVEVEVPQED